MKNMEMRALFDNTNQIKKIFYRFRSHGTFFLKALGKGIPLGELLLARFPYAFPDAALPPSMHVEVTNACNLKAGNINGDVTVDTIDAGNIVDYENGMVAINQVTGLAG